MCTMKSNDARLSPAVDSETQLVDQGSLQENEHGPYTFLRISNNLLLAKAD
jgi:hypothetical protein